MTTWVPGVDASFTDDKVVTPDQMQALKDSGVRVWMQCIWTASTQPPVAVGNLRNAIAAGLIPIVYISLAGNVPGDWHVAQARRGIPDDVWDEVLLGVVDVELRGIPNPRIREAVEAVDALDKGKAIYTSYGKWTAYQANATDFTDCWLFNALWDGNPDVDFGQLPYGGWTVDQVLSEQYTGGTLVEGVLVDRDTFNLEALEEIMGPTKSEFQQLFAYTKDTHDALLGLAGLVARNVQGDAQQQSEIDAITKKLTDASTALGGK